MTINGDINITSINRSQPEEVEHSHELSLKGAYVSWSCSHKHVLDPENPGHTHEIVSGPGTVIEERQV